MLLAFNVSVEEQHSTVSAGWTVSWWENLEISLPEKRLGCDFVIELRPLAVEIIGVVFC